MPVPVEDDCDRCVPRPGRDLVRGGAGGGPEAYSCVAEIMWAEGRQPSRFYRRPPEPLTPRVRPQRPAGGPGEDEAVVSRLCVPPEVLDELVRHLSGERHGPLARSGLRGPEVHVATNLDGLLGDTHAAPQGVEPASTKPGHLRESEPPVALEEDEGPVPRLGSMLTPVLTTTLHPVFLWPRGRRWNRRLRCLPQTAGATFPRRPGAILQLRCNVLDRHGTLAPLQHSSSLRRHGRRSRRVRGPVWRVDSQRLRSPTHRHVVRAGSRPVLPIRRRTTARWRPPTGSARPSRGRVQ